MGTGWRDLPSSLCKHTGQPHVWPEPPQGRGVVMWGPEPPLPSTFHCRVRVVTTRTAREPRGGHDPAAGSRAADGGTRGVLSSAVPSLGLSRQQTAQPFPRDVRTEHLDTCAWTRPASSSGRTLQPGLSAQEACDPLLTAGCAAKTRGFVLDSHEVCDPERAMSLLQTCFIICETREE